MSQDSLLESKSASPEVAVNFPKAEIKCYDPAEFDRLFPRGDIIGEGSSAVVATVASDITPMPSLLGEHIYYNWPYVRKEQKREGLTPDKHGVVSDLLTEAFALQRLSDHGIWYNGAYVFGRQLPITVKQDGNLSYLTIAEPKIFGYHFLDEECKVLAGYDSRGAYSQAPLGSEVRDEMLYQSVLEMMHVASVAHSEGLSLGDIQMRQMVFNVDAIGDISPMYADFGLSRLLLPVFMTQSGSDALKQLIETAQNQKRITAINDVYELFGIHGQMDRTVMRSFLPRWTLNHGVIEDAYRSLALANATTSNKYVHENTKALYQRTMRMFQSDVLRDWDAILMVLRRLDFHKTKWKLDLDVTATEIRRDLEVSFPSMLHFPTMRDLILPYTSR